MTGNDTLAWRAVADVGGQGAPGLRVSHCRSGRPGRDCCGSGGREPPAPQGLLRSLAAVLLGDVDALKVAYLCEGLRRRHGWLVPRGRVIAVAGYAALTLLCTAAAAWLALSGIAQLNLLGNAVEVRLAECHSVEGARGTTHTDCSGPVQNTTNARTVKVTYDGHKGETIRAARAPWVGYEAVDTGFVSRGISILFPVLPLFAVVGAGALSAREFRRARQPVAADGVA